MSQRAIFLDRDGTQVQHVRYRPALSTSSSTTNIGPELRTVQSAGLRIVVMTNQSRPGGSRRPGYHLDLMFLGVDVDLDDGPFIRAGSFGLEAG